MVNMPEFDIQQQMIERLVRCLAQNAGRFELHETHLSWVLVSDGYAYKIKKALHFDFVDYSSLASRRHFCEEELRLNRRLAPSIYLGVIPITGVYASPLLDGQGDAIEYALKMRAIEHDAVWDARLAKHLVEPEEIDLLAETVAEFHERCPIASPGCDWGRPELIQSIAASNFADLCQLVSERDEQTALHELADWNAEQAARLNSTFLKRRQNGFVRECHGDLHCGNVFTSGKKVQLFDCIEFNESLRWIDVINDISFVCMELDFHGYKRYAARFLNRYLERTGDYEGLHLLPYYATQRALVRSKVNFIKARQSTQDAPRANAATALAARYLAHARSRINEKKVCLMITHGLSGSGKTSFAREIVELTGAVQLRSDVERKRMTVRSANESTARGLHEGLYAPEQRRHVYDELCRLARHVLHAGFPVIVDAAFLNWEERRIFRELAEEIRLPFYIFHVQCDISRMKERIARRAAEGWDASDATLEVLEHQIAHYRPLLEEESSCTIPVHMDDAEAMQSLKKSCQHVLECME